MLAKISVDKFFVKARSHIMKEEFTEAKYIYQDILNRFPKNKRALKELANLKNFKQNDSSFFLPQVNLDKLVNLHQKGKKQISKSQSRVVCVQSQEKRSGAKITQKKASEVKPSEGI